MPLASLAWMGAAQGVSRGRKMSVSCDLRLVPRWTYLAAKLACKKEVEVVLGEEHVGDLGKVVGFVALR